ncbi:MAG: bifunctional folylpolyglutamate synthase/dihydrofolate synthase [Candidatus Rokubacteria bacterium]|nr:bifunctional folylpolyglutamate synthase/dihydrofolate synthase [Candidatus Rokubacteria bacterium]
MTYAEAVARLLALRGGELAGMRPGLERIEGLLAAVGNPERRYALVQIGGTNGKGSVAATLATILKASGRRVGLYTSPHLVSFRERIRVDGEPIAEDGVADGVDALGTLVARLDATVFEATTALALDHFAREAVDIAVLEVGLGGRLDATTVGRPALVVLTRIDLDHEAYLGSTLGEIAAEKAAIIRGGVTIAAAQAPEAARVIVDRAAAQGIPLLLEGRDLSVRVESRSLESQRIVCAGPGWALERLALPLLGRFQPGNALLAVAAARELGVVESAIRDGLARARWPGRFQVIGRDPWLVVDGAHNPAAARALVASLDDLFPGVRRTLVVGISRDKDARAILAALVPGAARLILTRASSPRAADPETLSPLVPRSVDRVEVAGSAGEALALAMAPPESPVVCVAGSLFLVGDVLARVAGDRPCPIEKAADSMECLFDRHARDTE